MKQYIYESNAFDISQEEFETLIQESFDHFELTDDSVFIKLKNISEINGHTEIHLCISSSMAELGSHSELVKFRKVFLKYFIYLYIQSNPYRKSLFNTSFNRFTIYSYCCTFTSPICDSSNYQINNKNLLRGLLLPELLHKPNSRPITLYSLFNLINMIDIIKDDSYIRILNANFCKLHREEHPEIELSCYNLSLPIKLYQQELQYYYDKNFKLFPICHINKEREISFE